MSKKVIFSLFNRFPSFFCSLALFGFFALAGLTQQLNLNLPKEAKVRDEVSFSSTAFPAAEKLDIRNSIKEPATSFISAVPTTANTYIASANNTNSASNVKQSALFSISNPTPVSSPSVDAGNGVMRYIDSKYGYSGKFLYAHSTRAFSPLKTLYVGSTFVATIDGNTATYSISKRYVFNKSNDLDGGGINNRRRDSIYRGKELLDNGATVQHSLALMTCGNGANDDSNYRLVLYADQI